MSGLNYLKLGSTLSNICNTTQLGNTTKCHYAFKNFWGEPCRASQSKCTSEAGVLFMGLKAHITLLLCLKVAI